jgi:SAM-dependent methyltransferase
MTTTADAEWTGYIVDDFTFANFPPGARVLDVGFGGGQQVRRLLSAGCRAFAIELDPELAASGRAAGYAVSRAKAEEIPFRDASLDGLICKVVIPYTDEARAIAEIARVLRRGGTARLSCHGLGYSLRYLVCDRDWKRRVYAARVLFNTALYALTGRRLPGFLGDTLYQSRRRLLRYYRRHGLDLVADRPAARFLGAPVFIYHTVTRIA